MTAAPDIIPPRPATHAWCPVCRVTTPIRYGALSPASAARTGGKYDGDRLTCARCETAIATVLIETTEA